jgi:hypothetical protein
MTFYRVRSFGDRRYLYREERWREGGKVRSRSRSLGRLADAPDLTGITGSPLWIGAALPFMIAHDLISGNRVEAMKQARGDTRDVPKDDRLVFTGSGLKTADQWNAERSTMSDDAWDRHVAEVKGHQSEAPAPERSYPAKSNPTDEEEAMHANWSANQQAQRDEDLDAYNASQSGVGDKDANGQSGDVDGGKDGEGGDIG